VEISVLKCFGLLFVLMGLAGACQRQGPLVVRDSEGRAFSVRCNEAETSCSLRPAAGVKLADGAAAVLRAEGRVIGVCDAVGEEARVHPADCRPLSCERDADCPPVHGPNTGSCLDQLCVDPAHELGPNDAVMLCLAGTGTGHAAPRQIERYALGLNCGTPCVVPSPCRQP
jgi:hypothetical protein